MTDEDETIEGNLMQPLKKYMIYKQRVLDGQMSVTPQFWMICMDLMEKQHHFHTTAQEGKFGGTMCAWEFFLPFFFSTNKHNHVRHGRCYKHQIRNREIHCTVATRSSSLFNSKQDTTSKYIQLLNSEDNNH